MQRSKGLDSNALKLIAILAMTVDHLTWALFPGPDRAWYVMALHIIGRLTAPIMWFFIAEGCHYTHDRKRYLLRLFVFAVVSHFAYCFAFGIPFFSLSAGIFNRTSVMWSLFLAALSVFVLTGEICGWKRVLFLVAVNVLAFPSDWSSIAVMAPLFLFFHRGDIRKEAEDIVFWTFVYALVYFFFLDRVYALIQMFTFLSVFLLRFYNGERGRWKGMKWFFYLYYPLHLVVVGVIRVKLHGDVSVIFQ